MREWEERPPPAAERMLFGLLVEREAAVCDDLASWLVANLAVESHTRRVASGYS